MAIFFQSAATWDFHIRLLLLVVPAAAAGLVALWAATSRVHWFWRALAVWACVMLLLPVRAHEPAMILMISLPLTVAMVKLLGWMMRRARPQPSVPIPGGDGRVRFALHDLFLLMLLVGLNLAGLLHLSGKLQWTGGWHVALLQHGQAAVALAAVTTLAWACVVARRRVIFGLMLALTVAAFGSLIPAFGLGSTLNESWTLLGVTFNSSSRVTDFGLVAAALAELGLLLILILALARASGQEQRLVARIARGAIATLTLVVAVPLAILYWQMLWLAPLPPRFSDAPTHFARLAEIGERMSKLPPAGATTAAQQERQALLVEAADLAEMLNYVPYDPARDATQGAWTRFWQKGQAFRDLARTINAEAAAFESRGDQATACDLTLINVRLGVMLHRGSTIIDSLIGTAIQGVAHKQLADLRRHLPPDNLRQAIAALARAEAECEDVALIQTRDRAMTERAFGWAARLENLIEESGAQSNRGSALLDAQRRRIATGRLLQADLAIRLFQNEHGHPPPTLNDLVPAYLPAVPLDPYSNQPLQYRLDGGDFILYSVGKDGRDNGGRFTSSRTYLLGDGYDFDLDTLTRP